MGAVILTLPGPWDAMPDWDSPLDLTLEGPDPHLAADIKALARQANRVEDFDFGALKRHQAVIRAVVDFDAPGDLAMAHAGARLMVQAAQAGAHAVMVETATKAHDPGSLEKGLDLDDPVSLLHLFVEVFVEGDRVVTEGLQAFDLPDIVAPAEHPAEKILAQGAVFACAALMVCEGADYGEGAEFQASESAPRWRVHAEPLGEGDLELDPMANPRGYLRLRRLN